MSQNNIKIEVLGLGGNVSSSPANNSPLLPPPPSPQAQAAAQTLGMGNASSGNPAPLTQKDRTESLSWMEKRNVWETNYNRVLNERLTTLQQMAKLGYSPQSGGSGSGGGGNGNTPNSNRMRAEMPSFMGVTAVGWGAVGQGFSYAGQLNQAVAFNAMKQSQIEKDTALAKNAFALRQMEGDYSGIFFGKEREQGKKNAPSAGSLFVSDVLGGVGGLIKSMAIGATATSLASAAYFAPGFATPLTAPAAGAGILGAGVVGGLGAGGLFLADKFKNNLNYSADLKKRVAQAQTESEILEIEKDPEKKKLVDKMSAAGGSTSGIINSVGFVENLAKAGYASQYTGENLGKLLSGSSAGEAQKTLIYNIAEGMRLGIDKSEYRKEFDTFQRMLTEGEVGANIRTKGGAEDYSRTFTSYIADPTRMAGLQSSGSVLDFASNQQQKGVAYEASFLARGRNAFGGKVGTQLQGLMDTSEADITKDNPYVQTIALEKGISTEKAVEMLKDMRYHNAETYNPNLTRARNRAAKLGDIRFGVSSPAKVLERRKVQDELAYQEGIAAGKIFTTQDQQDALLARTNSKYRAGLTPDKIKATEAAGGTVDGLGTNADKVGEKFSTLAGITQQLIDVINQGMEKVKPIPYTPNYSSKGSSDDLAYRAVNNTKVAPKGTN